MLKYFRKVVSASLSPDTEGDDIWLAVKILFAPWHWTGGSAVGRAEDWFEKYFSGFHAISFNSGRSALYALLLAFNIGKNDEVFVQSFTCVAVPNSVLWVGAKPVYIDIDASLNIDITDASEKLTKKTRAIIVQHTFGLPANMDAILAFAGKHKLVVIEDCAHSLGATSRGKKVGLSGDAAFFSFGRDKVISSVFGGMAIVSNAQSDAWLKLKNFHKHLTYPSRFWTFQQIIHPVIFSVVLPFYNIGLGKVILVIFQRLKLLSFPVYSVEKQGQRPQDFPAKYPNGLALMFLKQITKLTKFNSIRKNNAARYVRSLADKKGIELLSYPKESIYLRFPVLAADPERLRLHAKKEGILLGNWYHNVIDPVGVDFKSVGYILGSCPRAESVAKHILNLPTLLSTREVDLILKNLA